ncbi:PAS domain-containing protein [Haloprofundus marisrubri]|nr:PAS domain-containing protein [Haloprofundus marisrubri]
MDCLRLDERAFRPAVVELHDEYGLGEGRLRESLSDGFEAFDGPDELDDYETFGEHERRLVWRIWLLDAVSLGLTLSGPVYQDNPLIYANSAFRELTGYSMAELRGENPRLLQGPETESSPVDDLREALDIWEPVTVELWNYRKDGTPFRNRVSLLPVEDDTGMVTNWVGVQERVDHEADSESASN